MAAASIYLLVFFESGSQLVVGAAREYGVERSLVCAPFAGAGFVQVIRILSRTVAADENEQWWIVATRDHLILTGR